MRNELAVKMKKFIPIAIVSAILSALMIAAFLLPPRVKAQTAVAYADKIDADAVRALDNATAYVCGNDFKSTMNGVIKARAFGIPYTQKIKGGRSVVNGVYDEYAESKSALVKAAFKKSSDGEHYSVRKGNYKNKKFVYGKPIEFTENDFIAAYGKPAFGIVKYEIDGAITEAKVVGDGVYRFKLDSRRATAFSRNEVKTLLGGDGYPKYENITVTLYTKGGVPVKAVSTEKFRVDKFGGVNCTAQYTEVFDFS